MHHLFSDVLLFSCDCVLCLSLPRCAYFFFGKAFAAQTVMNRGATTCLIFSGATETMRAYICYLRNRSRLLGGTFIPPYLVYSDPEVPSSSALSTFPPARLAPEEFSLEDEDDT